MMPAARNPELPCDACPHGKYTHQPCEHCDTPEQLAAFWPDFVPSEGRVADLQRRFEVTRRDLDMARISLKARERELQTSLSIGKGLRAEGVDLADLAKRQHEKLKAVLAERDGAGATASKLKAALEHARDFIRENFPEHRPDCAARRKAGGCNCPLLILEELDEALSEGQPQAPHKLSASASPSEPLP